MRKILFTLALFSTIASCSQPSKSTQTAGMPVSDSSAEKPATATLAFTGDVMLGTNVPRDFLTADRGKTLLKDCRDIMHSADITIVNLEGTCYDGTDGEQREMTNPNTYYIFRMPGDHAARLAEAGVDAVNMANNHSFDFGMTGRRNTLRTMKGVGIDVVGLRDMAEGTVLERDGVKYGYLGFAASCTKVLDMLDSAEVDSMIKKYRRMCDVLIVSFHGGAEGGDFQHVPMKEEYYVGEDRGDVHRFAHRCIDLGADMVIGHGPHVVRAMELYRGHLIAYSLGNFCTPYRISLAGVKALAPLLEVKVNTKDGTFASGHIYSYIQAEGVGPRTDKANTAAKTMKRLTEEDFPNSGLTITDDGKVSVNKP